MKVVVDASVALKWFLWESQDEPDAEAALALLPMIQSGRLTLFQPVHWRVEVLAVASRQKSDLSSIVLERLRLIPLTIVDTDAVYLRATALARRFNHHMFDTMYHAAALEMQATLVTADERYFAAAMNEGAIQRLQTFSGSLS